MKKILLVAMALMIGFGANAQFDQAKRVRDLNATKGAAKSTWYQTATPFTTYDFRDTQHANPISLQAWMDSGFCVVVDYSATWCGPCWNLHNSGVLEGFYDAFGPEGTNILRVLWVEGDEDCGTADILGNTSSSQGDWTLGGTVPFPMADDEAVINSFPDFWASWLAYPCVVLATPEGFYTPIYGSGSGVITSFDVATCNANLLQVINNRPQAGQAPVVDITGPTSIKVGNTATFTASIASVDPITSMSWTFDGGTPATANTETASTVWNTEGNHTVTFTATNANGTTTKTMTVNAFSWNWGATMGYCLGHESNASAGFRLNSGSTSTWAVMFPAEYMNGRQYLKNVEYYAIGAINYTLTVYQGGETTPESQIYTRTLKASGEGWQTMNVSGSVALDQTKSLWISLTAPHATGYVMSVIMGDDEYYYSGDPNGCWAQASGQWANMADMGYEVTWALKATTANSPNADIEGVLGSELNIYPNPTTGKVSIDVENFVSATVMDIAGRTVMTSNESTIDMSSLTNGVYMVRINTTNGSATQKVVKR